MGKKKNKKSDKAEEATDSSKAEEETKIEENKVEQHEQGVEAPPLIESNAEEKQELKEEEEIKKQIVEEVSAIVEDVSTIVEPIQLETVSTIAAEKTLYLSSIGENNESIVQMPEMIIPGTLTETQVSLPVDNNSSGSEKEAEVQQDEVVEHVEKMIPAHDLHVPAAQIPKIIEEEEEDDGLSQAEFMRMQEAQNRALRLRQEEVERFREQQEEMQRKEMMRREIEKNKSHFVISSIGEETREPPRFQHLPQRAERSHLIVEESKEYQLPINQGNQAEEERLTLKKAQNGKEEDESTKYSTLQKVGAGLAIAAIIVYTGAKFLMKKTPKKIL